MGRLTTSSTRNTRYSQMRRVLAVPPVDTTAVASPRGVVAHGRTACSAMPNASPIDDQRLPSKRARDDGSVAEVQAHQLSPSPWSRHGVRAPVLRRLHRPDRELCHSTDQNEIGGQPTAVDQVQRPSDRGDKTAEHDEDGPEDDHCGGWSRASVS